MLEQQTERSTSREKRGSDIRTFADAHLLLLAFSGRRSNGGTLVEKTFGHDSPGT